jgi:hypothetical protein
MSARQPTFKYARDGGALSYTGKFEITLEEIEKGYLCGKICHEDGSIFIGKYYQDESGKTKMVEGRYTYKCGKLMHLGKFWDNQLDDGLVIEDGKKDGRVLPFG